LHPRIPRVPALQSATERVQAQISHLLHIESFAGMVLMLAAAAAALIWANSAAAPSYFALWHAPVADAGPVELQHRSAFHRQRRSDDGVLSGRGHGIRRELHNGALASLRQASLPLIAAIGGVAVPALIYVALAGNDRTLLNGWAIPTATDIAFAVGVLALLGRNIPGALRIFLLALAIIDDIVAVLIIAFFYSGGLQAMEAVVAAAGVLLVLLFNRMGIAAAPCMCCPEPFSGSACSRPALTHSGRCGAGSDDACVCTSHSMPPLITAQTAMRKAGEQMLSGRPDPQHLLQELRTAQLAQRDLCRPLCACP
jgi:NhaA family Na+:H+ antiporter